MGIEINVQSVTARAGEVAITRDRDVQLALSNLQCSTLVGNKDVFHRQRVRLAVVSQNAAAATRYASDDRQVVLVRVGHLRASNVDSILCCLRRQRRQHHHGREHHTHDGSLLIN